MLQTGSMRPAACVSAHTPARNKPAIEGTLGRIVMGFRDMKGPFVIRGLRGCRDGADDDLFIQLTQSFMSSKQIWSSVHHICVSVNVYTWIKAWIKSVHYIKWSWLFRRSIWITWITGVVMKCLWCQSFGGIDLLLEGQKSQGFIKISSFLF